MMPWIRAIDDLAMVCCASPASQQGACWRNLVQLLTAAPIALRALGLVDLDSAAQRQWVAHEAWETLVLSILDEDLSFLVSHGGSGRCLASVVLRGRDEEITSEGSTFALAVMSALLVAILDAFGDS